MTEFLVADRLDDDLIPLFNRGLRESILATTLQVLREVRKAAGEGTSPKIVSQTVPDIGAPKT